MPNPDTLPIAGTRLAAKVRGCLYGGGASDARGAPAEGRSPAEIKARYGEILDFVELWDGPSPVGKGDGRYTDDTHMVRLLARIYLETDDHLDPFVFARAIVPLIADEPRWRPEWGREAPLVERLFSPEKWLRMRLRLANCDPRLGGVGNMVNCGAAMYAAAIAAVVERARGMSDWRAAIRPFDGAADDFHDRGNGSDDWNPSRTRSIEDLPVALGFLVVTNGDLVEAIRGAANYGRDNDSIAGMAGATAGALHGISAIPSSWVARIDAANRTDLGALANRLAALAVRMQRRALARAVARDGRIADLLQPTSGSSS